MSKRILIVGAGGNQVEMIKKARQLGFYTIAMDGSGHAPGFVAEDVQVAVADRRLHLLIHQVHHRVAGALAARARGGRAGDVRLQGARHRLQLAERQERIFRITTDLESGKNR